MKVRCINRPPYTMCPPEVEAPASYTSLAVMVPDGPAFTLEPGQSETLTHRVGTVPIRRVRALGGWEWVADFNELEVPE